MNWHGNSERMNSSSALPGRCPGGPEARCSHRWRFRRWGGAPMPIDYGPPPLIIIGSFFHAANSNMILNNLR